MEPSSGGGKMSLNLPTTAVPHSKFVYLLSIIGIVAFFTLLSIDMLFYAQPAALPIQYLDKSDGVANILLAKTDPDVDEAEYELNNYGHNVNKTVLKSRQRDAPDSELKTILMWNDAYGVREYDIGHGREPFYKYRCEETRCVATANRSYLARVEDFDALLIHQRGIEWKDMPKRRSPHQRYVHWVMESAQYLYMDIHKLDGMFNWTMTYKDTSDFVVPYGIVQQVRPHPHGDELREYIREFGQRNRHLAGNRTELKAAWFVSHCATQGRREQYARAMRRHMDVHIYGKCGKYKCSRKDEWSCYRMMEREYRFYLSFENSVCDDYVTEKFFNLLKFNVIPVTFSGGNYSRLAPPHSSVNVFSFTSPKKLVEHLQMLQTDDAKFAEYFWWRDFYELRNRVEDRAQPYCDLCKRLHNKDEPDKVYENMYKWWVTDSHCKKIRPGFLKSKGVKMY